MWELRLKNAVGLRKTAKKTKIIKRRVQSQGRDRGCRGGKNLGGVSRDIWLVLIRSLIAIRVNF